jgi:hypothetical protein
MLHIRCGDDILGKLKEAELPGEMIRWADALCQGPTPWGVTFDEWRTVRAQHAADFYGVPFDDGFEFLRKQDENLQRFHDHDEIVLWFEHDLFDQIVLIYLLNWFTRQEPGSRTLWLICPDRHIGNMSAEELAELYWTKHRITAGELALAGRAWQAFCAPDPTGIEGLLDEDTSSLPHLALALRRHLQEFPSTKNGLGRTEQAALERIATGTSEPARLFHEVQAQEERFWLGDSMFWPYLEKLAVAKSPLLRVEGTSPWPSRERPRSMRRLFITRTGETVLAGTQDHVRLNGMDRWFGGVHLQGTAIMWRWDDHGQALARIEEHGER